MEKKIIISLIILIIVFLISEFLKDYFLIEKFGNKKNILKGNNIFDDFYCKIYDILIGELPKNRSESGIIYDHALKNFKNQVRLLDIGCGPAKHLFYLCNYDYSLIPFMCGVDKSKSMLDIAKKNTKSLYKNKCQLVKGDVLDYSVFSSNSFSHIICMYFTFYYFKNQQKLMKNIYAWLKPKGVFCVHLVNRDKFDPMLDRGNPFLGSLQKYSNERLTKSFIKFNNINYKSEFVLDSSKEKAYFNEVFEFNSPKKKTRKQKHTLNMPSLDTIVSLIKSNGFKEIKRIDLLPIGYEYNYLLFFKKLTT